MEIPAPEAGTVKELKVAVGDAVSEGSALVVLEVEAAAPTASDGGGAPAEAVESPAEPARRHRGRPTRTAAQSSLDAGAEVERGDVHADVLVLGSGPGGYAAAFRAADLGLDVVMVERYTSLGGVCLNVGCIPSKALLHVAKVIAEAETAGAHGVALRHAGDRPRRAALVEGGRRRQAHRRRRADGQGPQGAGRHAARRASPGPNMLAVLGADGETTTVSFDHAIVAAGSRSVQLPGIPHDDPRVMDSTGALELADIPERLLVVGGGIIGLEMATVYDALGSQVTVVELADGLIPGADRDLVKPLAKRIGERYAAIHLETKVDKIEAKDDGLHATFSGDVERRRLRPRAGRGRPDPQRRVARPGARGRARRRARLRRASTPSSGPTSRTSTRSATSPAGRCSPTRRRPRATSRPR